MSTDNYTRHYNLSAQIGVEGQQIILGESNWLRTPEARDTFIPRWVKSVRDDGYDGPLFIVERTMIDTYTPIDGGLS